MTFPNFIHKWQGNELPCIEAFVSRREQGESSVRRALIIPAGRWRQVDPWGLLTSQPRLLNELQVNERLPQNGAGVAPEEWHPIIVLLPPHITCTPSTHECTHINQCTHAQNSTFGYSSGCYERYLEWNYWMKGLCILTPLWQTANPFNKENF